jgi:flagellar hook-length control protein FliK
MDDAPGDTQLGDVLGTVAQPLAAGSGDAPGLPSALPFDAATLLQQNPQIAAAQALQAADLGVAGAGALLAPAVSTTAAGAAGAPLVPASTTAAAATAAAAARVLPQSAALGPATSSPIAAAQPPLFADAASTPTTTAAAASPPRSSQAVDAAGKTSVATRGAKLVADTSPAQSEQAASSTQGLQQAFAMVRAGKDALQSGGERGATDSGKTVAAADPAKLMTALEQSKATTVPSAPEPVLSPLWVKLEKSQGERERNGFDVKRSEPTYSGTTLGFSLPDVSQSGAAAPVLAPEMQVAEQVSYWVSHNVQNAELSLDGLGQSPVQVSISLQGNEAQISFRTDEAAAREVLQNAGAHLKDMLQSEGLVLTGVSVGHSGSGNADGGERRPRQNVRQTAIAPLQSSNADSRPGRRTASMGSAGQAVDLFV